MCGCNRLDDPDTRSAYMLLRFLRDCPAKVGGGQARLTREVRVHADVPPRAEMNEGDECGAEAPLTVEGGVSGGFDGSCRSRLWKFGSRRRHHRHRPCYSVPSRVTLNTSSIDVTPAATLRARAARIASSTRSSS